MKVTVILCTFNRCHSLAKALQSLAVQRTDALLDWYVLVVDNNSSDQTREVVGDFCRREPEHFAYLHAPQSGKSYALNAGIREARGDILAFVDDDVIAEPMWLQNLTAGSEDPAWAGAGGRIVPDRPFSAPPWLAMTKLYALAPLALFDLGPNACELKEPPYGTNMAFRKEMFEKYGGFRTGLGPRPGSMIRNEDTEFGYRLFAGGERLRYEPSAVVYHSIPDDRVQKKYFLHWWFAKGRADIRQFGPRAGSRYFMAGVPMYLLRNLAVWLCRWALAFNPSKRFHCKLVAWGKAGEIVECYQESRSTERRREPNAG